MKDTTSLSGTEIAAMIQQGEVTSIETVEAHIEKIKRTNPQTNAVVQDRFDQARQEAELADKAIKTRGRKKLPPFHGVPCTIKESFALTGMPNTAGLVARKGIIAQQDAPAVDRIRKAGAIPLGVTNIPELCMWLESDNRIYGRTNCAYSPNHICGGSSGGEGSVIGSGASPFGLGSDIGGSIRLPAFFNGIFGHKPTGGLVPNTGQYPTPEKIVSRYCTTGPLCRKATDLMPLLRILAGPDNIDPECKAMDLGKPGKVRMDKLKVVSIPRNPAVPVSQDLATAQSRAAWTLGELGARVERHIEPRLKDSFWIWSAMLEASDTTKFGVHLGDGKPVNLWKEFPRWLTRKTPHTLPALILALLEKAPVSTEKFLQLGKELSSALTQLIGPDGVMLYPTYSSPAPRHYLPMLKPFHAAYTVIMNVMGFPVTQVPLGLNGQGLPLGVQVVGLPGNDHVTIAVAMALEKALGGWVPPE